MEIWSACPAFHQRRYPQRPLAPWLLVACRVCGMSMLDMNSAVFALSCSAIYSKVGALVLLLVPIC